VGKVTIHITLVRFILTTLIQNITYYTILSLFISFYCSL